MSHFDDQHDSDDDDYLLTSDVSWWQSFEFQLGELEDNAYGQLSFKPLDDLLGAKRYIACSQRGTHLKITECWLCWCDWAWGYAPLATLLAPKSASDDPHAPGT